jgi:cytochrome c5
LGAPKIGDGATWEDCTDHQGGLYGILAGINSMPPKGTCADRSDAELKGAIQKMSGLK